MAELRPTGDVLFLAGAILVVVGLIGTRTSLGIVFLALAMVGLVCASPGLVFIAASHSGTAVEVLRRTFLVLGLWFVAVGFAAGLGTWPLSGVAVTGVILLLAGAVLYIVARASPERSG